MVIVCELAQKSVDDAEGAALLKAATGAIGEEHGTTSGRGPFGFTGDDFDDCKRQNPTQPPARTISARRTRAASWLPACIRNRKGPVVKPPDWVEASHAPPRWSAKENSFIVTRYADAAAILRHPEVQVVELGNEIAKLAARWRRTFPRSRHHAGRHPRSQKSTGTHRHSPVSEKKPPEFRSRSRRKCHARERRFSVGDDPLEETVDAIRVLAPDIPP